MPSRSKFFVRRVVVPVVVLVCLGATSWSWLRPGRIPGQFVDKCLSYQLKKGEPPADLLLLGSSRTGNGLDPKVIRDNLEAESISTVEKFALMGQSEVDANMAYRTYEEHRGAPRVLGIELTFARTATITAPFKSMLSVSERSSVLFDATTYGKYLADQVKNQSIHVTDIFAQSIFVSPVSYFFGRFNISIEQALRHPTQALRPLRNCGDDVLRMWSEGFSTPLRTSTPAVAAEKLTAYESVVARYPDVVFTNPRVLGELAVLSDTVRLAKESGVGTIFFYYMPSYSEPKSAMNLEALQALRPDWNIFDFRPFINDPTRPILKTQFLDANHFNAVAAYEASQVFATFINETVK